MPDGKMARLKKVDRFGSAREVRFSSVPERLLFKLPRSRNELMIKID
jgi:hypothetical protein